METKSNYRLTKWKLSFCIILKSKSFCFFFSWIKTIKIRVIIYPWTWDSRLNSAHRPKSIWPLIQRKQWLPYCWTLLVWGSMTSKANFVTLSCFYSFQVLSKFRSFQISFQFFHHWKKLFQPFSFFFKMSVWLKIRTWSYHVIKRHKSYDHSLDFVLILSYHETMLYVKRLHTD